MIFILKPLLVQTNDSFSVLPEYYDKKRVKTELLKSSVLIYVFP